MVSTSHPDGAEARPASDTPRLGDPSRNGAMPVPDHHALLDLTTDLTTDAISDPASDPTAEQVALVDQVQRLVGYRFRDPALIDRALRHSSSADSRFESNERMEFFGDAVLGYLVCEHLFHHYPDLLEGDMTKVKSSVVSRKTCALVSDRLGLEELLTLGKGMTTRSRLPRSVLAAVLEALIAALYLDGGTDAARAFVNEHLGNIIAESAGSTHHQNYKSALQQHCQQQRAGSPVYVLLDEKGPDHDKAFEVAVELGGRRFESHWAASKKEAEQGAALNALIDMGLARREPGGKVRWSG